MRGDPSIRFTAWPLSTCATVRMTILPERKSLYSGHVTIEDAVSSGAAPALLVRTQGFDRLLQAGPSYRVGRDPASDVVIDESRVSWQHAILRLEAGCWLLADSGSTNGMFRGPQRVQQVQIT